ncbi:sialidase family protein [Ramlibacter sp. Leaf400]|uniref:sialidase family protein n=1 Tax=Ramlibacter sp. Leaf400 TaxID=1736365 RepID=UPI0006F30FB2|nr:sialidase family protein [Ramlibacter sp. Leaf400]KQT14325.1 hypothetical protein ASG30_01730 [Ramlibacter sp. Leaf400]
MVSRRSLLAVPLVAALPLRLAASEPRPAVQWQAPVELARGRGERGLWRQNDSRYDFVDDPAVALARDGAMVVAWVDQARKAVLVQRRDVGGAPSGSPIEVPGNPKAFSWIPRIALAPDAPRTAYLLWQEIIFSGGSHGGEMLFARSTDGGRSFSSASNLSASPGGDGKGRITPEYWHNGSYDLLAAGEGRVWAAWTEYDGPLWIAHSAKGGESFGRPVRVAGGAGQRPARAPALAMARDGAVLLAWTEGDHAEADIQLARSSDGGTFDAPVVVRSPGYSDAPRLAVDRQGVVHLVWGESEGGPFRRQRVLYARSRDGGRRWEAPRTVVGSGAAASIGAGFPSLGLDANGGVVVLAELQEDLRQRPRGLAFAVSTDGGATFAAPQLVPNSRDPGGGFNGSSQGLLVPKLAVNARGDVVVVNSALSEGSHSRVWLVGGRLMR